jgi:hypothetical protein
MRYLFIILLIIYGSTINAQSNMQFIKVLPQNGLTSEQRAEAISRELFRIQRPINQQNDVTQYLFGWIKHPTKDPNYLDTVNAALQIDTNQVIYVHPDNDLTNLIALFPELSQAEKDGLAAFIESQASFMFQYIIPSDVTVFDEAQMKAAGWLPEPELFGAGL